MSEMPGILANGRSRDVSWIVLAGLTQAAGMGLAAFAMRDIFSSLHSGNHSPLLALALLALAGIGVALMRIVSMTIGERLGQSYALSLRKVLYLHFAGMSYSGMAQRRAGAVGLRFVGDLAAVQNWVAKGLTHSLSASIVLPSAVMALILLNQPLFIAVVIPLVLTLVLMACVALYLEPLHRRLRSSRARIAISMMERVTVAPELDLLGRTKKEVSELERNGQKLRDEAVSRVRTVSVVRAIAEMGVACAGVVVLWNASRLSIPAAEAAGVLAILGIIAVTVRELATVWDQRCAWHIAREKCQTLFTTPSRPRRVRKKRSSELAKAAVNVSRFNTATTKDEILVEAGETVMVCGATGSGKSGLLALWAGLENPGNAKGHGKLLKILPTKRIPDSKRAYRPTTVFIGPRSPILQGSLRKALALGVSPRPTDEVIDSTAREYGLGSVLDRLNGLDGRLTEGARNLSSGEQFRVQLTRAKLSQPDLLIIDTPESNQDRESLSLLSLLLEQTRATTLIACGAEGLPLRADRHWSIENGHVVHSLLQPCPGHQRESLAQ